MHETRKKWAFNEYQRLWKRLVSNEKRRHNFTIYDTFYHRISGTGTVAMKEKKKRISQKMLTEFIAKVADLKVSDRPDDGETRFYFSKIDGAYFTHEGMEKQGFKFLLKHGITKLLQNKSNVAGNTVNLGFNPEQQKWFGWSHRTLYGFGIGSTCKKGDCGYTADNVDELYDSVTVPDENGWAWQKPENVEKRSDGIRIKHEMTTLGPKFITDAADYMVEMDELDLESPKQTTRSGGVAIPIEPEYQYIKCGRGEWTAETLEDAKQMAIDFAKSVS